MPTVTIGQNTSNTYAGCEDLGINSDAPTSNFNAFNMNVQRGTATKNSLIRVTGLANIAASATVTDATLYLYKTTSAGGTAIPTITVYRCLRPWVEAQATWTNYATGNAWDAAGCNGSTTDYDPTLLVTYTAADNSNGVWYGLTSPELITVCQAWVSGSYANNGVVMYLPGPTGAALCAFSTAQSGSDGQRPYLEVTYTLGSNAGTRRMLMGCG